MPKAVWQGQVIAEAAEADTVTMEGSVYFPPSAVSFAHLRPTGTTTRCPWRGVAHYFTVVVGAAENEAAAWSYPSPGRRAARIRGFFAFWKGIEVTVD